MVMPRRDKHQGVGQQIEGAHTRQAQFSGAGVTSNNEFMEDGYDQEKWGTPQEWDKAIGSFGNNIAQLTTENIQAKVRENRLAAAAKGHKEARQ